MIAKSMFHAGGDEISPNKSAILTSPHIWVALTIWGSVAGYLSFSGFFEVAAGELPVSVIIAALGPGLFFLAVYAAYKPLRNWVASLDLAEVIAMQSWRVIGFAFLIVWSFGNLPAIFALPAGLGDIAVGLSAPVAALAVTHRRQGWRTAAYGITFAGITDFIVAFATGVLSRQDGPLHFEGTPASTLLGELPLSLFPTFIVPAFLILHLIALLKLKDER